MYVRKAEALGKVEKARKKTQQLEDALKYCRKYKCGGRRAMATKRFSLLSKTTIDRHLRGFVKKRLQEPRFPNNLTKSTSTKNAKSTSFKASNTSAFQPTISTCHGNQQSEERLLGTP